ncbi:MAG: hypothetical protein U9P00_14885 [Pseudomonadota bacterium]|nr:hypothetical protein [Pseudomonadota bacterium]
MSRQACDALRTVRKTTVFLFVLAGCGLYSALVLAGEITELVLSNKQGIYQLKLEIILDAPAKHIHHVVTDYAHIYRLNPSIVESEIIKTSDNSVVRVKTLINDCFWIFCREILRVEDVRELETGNIYAEIVPQLSNIKSGVTIWQIEPLGRRTRVNYNMIVEPGFVVPPLIGSHIVKQKLRREVLVTLSNIERIARIRNEKGAGPNLTLHENPLKRIPNEHDSAN